MASPITTSGFGVNVMPSTQLADPRLLTPQYSQILPAIGQGVGLGNNLLQIYQDAQDRPLRQALAQLNLEQQQLQNARLAQPIETVTGISLQERPRYDEVTTMTDAGTEFKWRPPGADLLQIEEVRTVDPRTGQVTTSQRAARPLMTLEQRQAAEDKTAYNESIAAIRAQEAETRRIAAEAKAQNDALRAQVATLREERLSKDPALSNRTINRNGTLFIQYFNKDNPAVVVEEVEKGPVTQSGILALLSGLGGQGNLAAPPPVSQPQNNTAVDPAVSNLINRLSGGATQPAKTPTPSTASQPTSAHIDYLRRNPDLAQEFDKKFGQGAAAKILSSRG